MAHTIKTTLPCVDAHVTTVGQNLQQGKRYLGSFVYEDDDNVRFVEKQSLHVEHPELHWRLLDRTKHGRIHTNANHIKVEFYIKHGDYRNGRDLADILASEIETMGESLSDMDLEEEVALCGK
jgi:Zn-dependent metalloprotease